MKKYLLGIVLIFSCAHSQPEPFSVQREMQRTGQALYETMRVLGEGDQQLQDGERRAALMVRIAVLSALWASQYEHLTADERQIVDTMFRDLMMRIHARREAQKQER